MLSSSPLSFTAAQLKRTSDNMVMASSQIRLGMESKSKCFATHPESYYRSTHPPPHVTRLARPLAHHLPRCSVASDGAGARVAEPREASDPERK
jgi:hypothetical protein